MEATVPAIPSAPPRAVAPDTTLPLLLRLGVGLCFIGHGAYGLITKAAWLPYFELVGIGEELGWKLMPWIGTMDIAIGFFAMLWPTRALLVWAAIWTVWTALCRPLAGQGWSEFFERAGNYGVPIAILVVLGMQAPWWSRIPDRWPSLNAPQTRARLAWALRITTATLLAGHAGCALFLQKPALAAHYAPFVSESATHTVMLTVGWLEMALALTVLLRPVPVLLVGVCIWKLASECLFLLSTTPAPMFEVIERGGSYIAPLALAALLYQQAADRPASSSSSSSPASSSRPMNVAFPT